MGKNAFAFALHLHKGINLDRNTLKPLIVVSLTIGILFSLSIFKIGGALGPFEIRRINILSDLMTESPKKEGELSVTVNDSDKEGDEKTASQTNNPPEAPLKSKIPTNKEPYQIIDCSKEGEAGALDSFFEAVRDVENNGGKARIAYFGDSIIEGDLITGDLRKNLQETFGGRGVGFVPVTSVAHKSRNTINHEFSKDWQAMSIHPKLKDENLLGISGFSFLPKSDSGVGLNGNGSGKALEKGSWVEYEASKHFANTNSFSSIKLYYGPVDDIALMRYKIDDGKTEETAQLQQGTGVRELSLNQNGPVRKLHAQFGSRGNARIYGFSFEDDAGVYVDNYSIRGYSGLTLAKIPCDVYSGFDKFFHYRLIILHYGVNVSGFSTKREFYWYRKQIVNVVNHLKACFPDASILIISTSDIAVRQGTEVTTKPSIPLLVEAQYEIARETGAAFWNLYAAMGGKDSMVEWVNAEKPLASKDYTHLNFRGGKKVADMLTRTLLEEYDIYKTNHCNGKKETMSSSKKYKD